MPVRCAVDTKRTKRPLNSIGKEKPIPTAEKKVFRHRQAALQMVEAQKNMTEARKRWSILRDRMA